MPHRIQERPVRPTLRLSTQVLAAAAKFNALDQADRTGFDEIWGATAPRRFFGLKQWNAPRRWSKLAEVNSTRYKVFCASMADVFEDRDDLDAARAKLFALMEETSEWLDWLFVTKRPENIMRMVPETWATNGPSNVWGQR